MAKPTNTENTKVDIEAIKKAIRELESPKGKRDRERAALFAALYPDIRDQLNADVSKSAIIKKLVDYGVSISGPMFDELLADEAKRRGEPVPGKEADDVPAVESTNAPQTNAKEEVVT
ncbi:hypothetical protein [Paraburkholderia sp. GAS32]|uniref:hypothetical protein n=1 Tax=Paraburkholderia sp. GAS32 TaxID=3035129 RepID=UPI003D2540F4